jgi:aminoglycoside adenylyltransferase-like protein
VPDRKLLPPLDRIVPAFVDDLRATLGDELVALYLLGSAAGEGFDPGLSDLDLVVVTASTIDRLDFGPFAGLIDRLAGREPDWADRLDVVFVGRDTLRTFREGHGPFLEVSHENLLQRHDRADDWLETWFLTLDADWPIVGPPPAEIIAPIDIDEFLHVLVVDVERYVAAVQLDWGDGKLAYRLMTVCRLLRSIDSRALCSKVQGAEWVAERYPEWAPLIRATLEVRATGEERTYTPEARASIPAALAALAAEVVARGQ